MTTDQMSVWDAQPERPAPARHVVPTKPAQPRIIDDEDRRLNDVVFISTQEGQEWLAAVNRRRAQMRRVVTE